MPPPPSVPTAWWQHRRWRLFWSLGWALLAIAHVTQAIWVSGGTAYPGDLWDGRFNQLVHEHGYQWLRGVYPLGSPAQFHPVADTLGYGDTFIGTLPFYAILRWIGLDVERAWQAWFVVIAMLNVVAGFRLFRALGVDGLLRGPLVFAAVASSTLVWQAGLHVQMLPIFALLLAWTNLVRWQADRRAVHLLAAGGWWAWQFAAAPYVAFFGAVIALTIAGLWWLLGRAYEPAAIAPPAGDRGKWKWPPALLIDVAGWSLAAITAWIYFHAESTGTSRSMELFAGFSPGPTAWVTANPIALLYPSGSLAAQPNSVDQGWFAGFLPWLATALAFAFGIRYRTTPIGRRLLALAASVLLVLAFFTRWSEAVPGPWTMLAKHFALLRAFRVSGRVAELLQVAMVATAGLLLTQWRPRRGRFLPVALAYALALEGLAWHQPAMPLATARARTAAAVEAWQRAGDRPVLALAPGYTNERVVYFHLDAWSAALRLGRVTINGYSSGLPPGFESFFWSPTPENARARLAATGVPPDQVSLVERYSPAAEAALGIRHLAGSPVRH